MRQMVPLLFSLEDTAHMISQKFHILIDVTTEQFST